MYQCIWLCERTDTLTFISVCGCAKQQTHILHTHINVMGKSRMYACVVCADVYRQIYMCVRVCVCVW
jgi:hypothetical protein